MYKTTSIHENSMRTIILNITATMLWCIPLYVHGQKAGDNGAEDESNDRPALNTQSVSSGLDQRADANGLEINVLSTVDNSPIHTLRGHNDEVTSVKYFPDGVKLISGGKDRALVVWDTDKGRIIKKKENAHRGTIWAIDVSSDGKTIISAGSDSTIRIWDSKSLSLLRSLPKSEGWINAIDISSDDRYLASGGDNNHLYIWDILAGTIRHTLYLESESDAQNEILSLSYSDDDKYLVSGSYDGTIALWNAETGDLIKQITDAHEGWVSSVVYKKEIKETRKQAGELLFVSGGYDGIIKVWDGKTGQHIDDIYPSTNYQDQVITSLSFSKEGDFLASTSDRETIQLWEFNTRRLNLQINDPGQRVVFNPVKNRIATIGNSQVVKVWNTDVSAKELPTIIDLETSTDGSIMATADSQGKIKLWKSSAATPYKLIDAHRGSIWTISFQKDNTNLVSGGEDGVVRIWDVETGRRLTQTNLKKGSIYQVLFHPMDIVIVSTEAQTIEVLDASNGTKKQTLKFHKGNITALGTDEQASRFASAADNGEIYIWNFETKKIEHKLLDAENINYSLKFVGDDILISGGYDGYIKIWDLNTGKVIKKLYADKESILEFDMSADQSILAATCLDRKVRVWNLEKGTMIRKFQPSFNTVYSLRFGKENQVLLTGAYQNELKVLSF